MSRTGFFRDCMKNENLTLTLIGGENYEWIKEKRPENLRPRAISKLQTNAIYLEGIENNGQGSYLQIPQSSLMEYDGDTLCIYDFGIRDMTEEEKQNEQKAKTERDKYNEENPNSYSGDFWHMQTWYSKCSTPWINPSGLDWIKGKKRGQGEDYDRIYDKSIKGKLVLKYKVES